MLGVLYSCVLCFCICTCSAQFSMFQWKEGLEIQSLPLLTSKCRLAYELNDVPLDCTTNVDIAQLHNSAKGPRLDSAADESRKQDAAELL